MSDCIDVPVVRGSWFDSATNDMFTQNTVSKMVMYCGLH